jgi:hypothetical protein
MIFKLALAFKCLAFSATYSLNYDDFDHEKSSDTYKDHQTIPPCSCDQRKGACDFNCCCDPDCEDTAAFESTPFCVKSPTYADTIPMCNQFELMNTNQLSNSFNSLNTAICQTGSNASFYGDFFLKKTTLSSQDQSQLTNSLDNTNIFESTINFSTNYNPGDLIRVKYEIDDNGAPKEIKKDANVLVLP